MPIRITIDGTAGSGKSTTADEIAKYFNYTRINSGLIYRSVTFATLQKFSDKYDLDCKDFYEFIQTIEISVVGQSVFLNKRNISFHLRTNEVEEHVSNISMIAFVRKRVREIQLDLIKNATNGVVIDGRDTGTVLIPNAEFKFYMTAKPETRALRRIKDNKQSFEIILEGIKKRDERDKNRKEGKLVCPEDAIVIETDDLTFEEQIKKMVEIIENKRR